MTSKHYRWQTRWRVDHAAGKATHDSGLIVQFTGAAGSPGQAVNEADTLAALAVKNGPHNAPQMLRRLLKEAEELHLKAASHAAR